MNCDLWRSHGRIFACGQYIVGRNFVPGICKLKSKQEAQLMLTNPRDAFRGQSRSPNIVPFHMLGVASSCAIR